MPKTRRMFMQTHRVIRHISTTKLDTGSSLITVERLEEPNGTFTFLTSEHLTKRFHRIYSDTKGNSLLPLDFLRRNGELIIN